MRCIVFVVAFCVLAMFGASQVFAHDSIVSIDSIGGILVTPGNTPIVVPYLPYTLDIQGTVTHDGAGGLNILWLWAQDNGAYIYTPTRYFTGSGNSTLGAYSIPWMITSLGQHVITINATHEEGDVGVNTKCKAAPALATAYLKSMGLTNTLNGENLIRSVAGETGKGGLLWAREKCSSDYASRTITFVLDSMSH